MAYIVSNIKHRNLGTINQNAVDINFSNGRNITLYFSYETLVGIDSLDGTRHVIENLWGPTTGKLLNYLQPDKSKRLSREAFDAAANHVYLFI